MAAKVRRLTLCAMMAALSAALLLTGALPLATYCGPVLAMLPLAVAAEEAGADWALASYAAAAAVGALLTPEPEAALVFACAGFYPAVKGPLDRIRRRWVRGLGKLAVWTVVLLLIDGLGRLLLGLPEETAWMRWLLLLLGEAVFLLLDRLLGRLSLRWRRDWRRLLGFGRPR